MKDIFSVTDYKDDTIPLEYWVQIIAKKNDFNTVLSVARFVTDCPREISGFLTYIESKG